MDEYTFKHCPKGHYYQGDECPYCKAQTAKEFKLCSKGHYYQGDECPYCKVQTVEKFKDRYYPLDDIIVFEEDLSHMKTCPNGHAYGSRLNHCPYCGETEVCGRADLITSLPGSLKLVFDRETCIKINNGIENKVSELEIRYSYINGYKTDYRIVGLPDFNYNSIIKIGRQLFAGEEFIKYVDFMTCIKEFENH